MTSLENAFPLALVIGASRPFGAEIVHGLQMDGFEVVAGIDDVDRDQPFEALVVNAPFRSTDIRFRDLSDDEFRCVLEEHLYDYVMAVQFAAARMQKGGAIVHVASKCHLGVWGGVHQAAAGAALVAMGRSMALELGALGIRVNTLAPDYVGGAWDTPSAREQLAATVAWAVGSESRLMSGETILLDYAASLQMTQAARR